MKTQASQRVESAAAALAGRVHTQAALEAELFALVRGCTESDPRPPSGPARRMPVAGEVLPPRQRASWARGKTPYDGC